MFLVSLRLVRVLVRAETCCLRLFSWPESSPSDVFDSPANPNYVNKYINFAVD